MPTSAGEPENLSEWLYLDLLKSHSEPFVVLPLFQCIERHLVSVNCRQDHCWGSKWSYPLSPSLSPVHGTPAGSPYFLVHGISQWSPIGIKKNIINITHWILISQKLKLRYLANHNALDSRGVNRMVRHDTIWYWVSYQRYDICWNLKKWYDNDSIQEYIDMVLYTYFKQTNLIFINSQMQPKYITWTLIRNFHIM